MKKLALFLIILTLSACAGMTPQQTSTNALLAVHDTIKNVEDGIKSPCDAGAIPVATCTAIEHAILEAKPLYNTAVDLQVAWLTTGSGADQAAYQEKKQALDDLVGDAVALALKYGVKGEVDAAK